MTIFNGKKLFYHKELHQRILVIIIVLTGFIDSEQKINSKHAKMSVKIMTIVIYKYLKNVQIY